MTEVVVFVTFPSLVWSIIFLNHADKFFPFGRVKERVTPFEHVQPSQYRVISHSFNGRCFAQARAWTLEWEIEIKNPYMNVLVMNLKLFPGSEKGEGQQAVVLETANFRMVLGLWLFLDVF